MARLGGIATRGKAGLATTGGKTSLCPQEPALPSLPSAPRRWACCPPPRAGGAAPPLPGRGLVGGVDTKRGTRYRSPPAAAGGPKRKPLLYPTSLVGAEK